MVHGKCLRKELQAWRVASEIVIKEILFCVKVNACTCSLSEKYVYIQTIDLSILRRLIIGAFMSHKQTKGMLELNTCLLGSKIKPR